MDKIFIIAVAALSYMLTVTLLEENGSSKDLIRKRMKSISSGNRGIAFKTTEKKEEIPSNKRESVTKKVIRVLRSRVTRLANRSANANRSDRNLARTNKLAVMLYRAGIDMTPGEFVIIRNVVIACLAFISLVIASMLQQPINMRLLCAGASCVEVYMASNILLKNKASRRAIEIRKQVPDVIDLLSISVEAGMGFDQAVDYIVNNTEGKLIDELEVTLREMSYGKSRKEALLAMAERCDVDELTSFVSAVVQATTLGITMKSVLSAQSSRMRIARRNRVKEKAAKISTKLLLPMVLFIFPVLFIILLCPALMSIAESGIM